MESAPRVVATLAGGDVRCAAVDGALLAAGAGGALRGWRAAAAGAWLAVDERRAAHRYGVSCVAWSGAGGLLASGGVDGALRLWARGGARVRVLAAPRAEAVRALCWAGARVAAGHDDGALRVWAARGALLASLRAHEAALTALAAADDLALLLTADADGVLKVYDLNAVCGGATTPLHWVDGAHDLGALCAAPATHAPLAASAGHDALIRIWRFAKDDQGSRSVRAAATLRGHGGAVAALSWRGALLASGAADGAARVWRVSAAGAGACLHVLPAHARYLTAVALDHRHRYLVTGSGDKTLRVWALGGTRADTPLLPACAPHLHYALGDLEGIEAIPDEDLLEADAVSSEQADGEGCGGSGARRVCVEAAHDAALNCIAARGHLLATAASDGRVRVWEWQARRRRLRRRADLAAHEYPATLVALPLPALLSAGLDGTLKLWDIDSGELVRAVSAGGSEDVGAEAGGGVRGGGVARRAAGWAALLATDAGAAQLWPLAAAAGHDAAQPERVWGGMAAACVCAAWAGDARLAARGGAAGELRVWAPAAAHAHDLATLQDAHDLGVQALAWGDALSWRDSYVLATVGADSLLKLWLVDYDEEAGSGSLQPALSQAAHGGAVTVVCWLPGREHLPAHPDLDDLEVGAAGALVATGGEDRWARVWRVSRRGAALAAACVAAVPAPAPVLALALLPPSAPDHADLMDQTDDQLTSEEGDEETGDGGGAAAWWLVVGTLGGEAAVWAGAAPAAAAADASAAVDDAQPAPRHWAAAHVARWLAEYVAPHGSGTSAAEEAWLRARARDAGLTGAALLDLPLPTLLRLFGCSEVAEEKAAEEEAAEEEAVEEEAAEEEAAGEEVAEEEAVCSSATRARLIAELQWLRRPLEPYELEELAPHALLCPLSHRLLREPVRAADGFTYDRAALADHFLAEGGAVSGVTRRRLRSARVSPNLRLRDSLRAFLAQAAPHLYAHLQPALTHD